MCPMTQDDVLKSKLNNDVYVSRNAFLDRLNWQDFYNIFNRAYMSKRIDFISFASMNIDRCEDLNPKFKDIISKLSLLHPEKYISILSIIHLITKNNQRLNSGSGLTLTEKFLNMNPNKIPENLNNIDLFEPTVHEDFVDGFFIQCEGNTLWKIYKEKTIDEYTLNPGDLIFIPKGTKHSVFSLCPRAAISVSFGVD
jgi:mannose-6-phosphate isomerase-like protein (cupin superfamily)